MYAYDLNLFYKSQTSLAWMFDYGVEVCQLEIDDFYNRFLISDISSRFERGDSKVIAGMSGVEMAMYVIQESDSSMILPKPVFNINRSRAYWVGWSLACYQWIKNIPFSRITEYISIKEIEGMYYKYHEMDIRQFAKKLDERREEARAQSALRRMRLYSGYSQSELANLTEIPLKTIQAYEQGTKKINNANIDYILRISKVLGCSIEALLEL